MHIDTADTASTPGVRALLASLDDSAFAGLGVLFGADLCALGGTNRRSCWQPLKDAWQQIDYPEREQLTHQSTAAMRSGAAS